MLSDADTIKNYMDMFPGGCLYGFNRLEFRSDRAISTHPIPILPLILLQRGVTGYLQWIGGVTYLRVFYIHIPS